MKKQGNNENKPPQILKFAEFRNLTRNLLVAHKRFEPGKNTCQPLVEISDLTGDYVFLSSPASDYINGTIVTVDGGWMSR